VYLETSDGISIDREKRTQKADYKKISVVGEKGSKNESFVRSLYAELQLNPIEFLSLSEDEQNRIILSMVRFQWDLNWIKKQFGEVVPDVDYKQDILGVLHQIQADNGYYYMTRQDVNREIRNHWAMIEEIGDSLPENYKADEWRGVSLGNAYREIEKIQAENRRISDAVSAINNRDNKVRAFQADLEVSKANIDKMASTVHGNIEKELMSLKNRIKELETELAGIEEKKASKIEVAEKTYKANVAELEGELKQYEGLANKKPRDVTKLQKEAEHLETMHSHVREYDRMAGLQEEAAEKKAKSERFTEKIEHARALPGEILANANIPISGLTVVEGVPMINGLPVSNLSDGEKLELCIDIATQDEGALNILLLDGVERLAKADRDPLYKKLKEKGVQFIAARTTDDEVLKIVEL